MPTLETQSIYAESGDWINLDRTSNLREARHQHPGSSFHHLTIRRTMARRRPQKSSLGKDMCDRQ
jgi:hypothetical protein